MIHTKKASLIILRRLGCAPTMTHFHDFMFFYIGNREQLNQDDLFSISDSLTYNGKAQEFNINIIKNRFNFLMYNADIYKNIVFNYNFKPQIFNLSIKVLRYLELLICNNSDKKIGLSMNNNLDSFELNQG